MFLCRLPLSVPFSLVPLVERAEHSLLKLDASRRTGLDYNSVGPEHSHLKYIGRAEYIAADDFQCLKAFKMCTQLEGIIPALESSHAIWGGMQLAKTLPKDQDIVMYVQPKAE